MVKNRQGIRVVLVDEQATARARLRALLTELGHQVVGEAADWEQGLLQIREQDPQLIFLDLVMPGHGGLWIVDKLQEMAVAAQVVFVAAQDEFSIEVLQSEGRDYLLKPVQKRALQQLLERLQVPAGGRIDGHLHTRGTGKSRSRLVLTDIWFFQAEQGLVLAYDGLEKHPVGQTLRQLEADHGERFIRIHRSYLVDCHRIERLEPDGRGGVRVRIKGSEQTLPMSSRLVPRVRSAMSC